MEATLYYIHDPMCSWCWGFSPTWQQIRTQLPAELPVVYLLGGLAPDTDAPMPLEMQAKLQQAWHTISQRLGTRFNFDFWTLCGGPRSQNDRGRAYYAAIHTLANAQQSVATILRTVADGSGSVLVHG